MSLIPPPPAPAECDENSSQTSNKEISEHEIIIEAEVHQSDTAVNVSVVSVEEQIDSDLENLTTNHLNEQVPTTQL